MATDLDGSNWSDLLAAIKDADKYVALDLSAFTGMSSFNPKTSTGGEDLVISIALPDTTSSILNGTTTIRYKEIRTISGSGIKDIAFYAFIACTSLTSVSFPNAESIGQGAFAATSLTSVSFPNAESIGQGAFAWCTSLTSVSLPNATSIDNQAFDGCTSLRTVDFPKAMSIGRYVFGYTGSAALSISLGPIAPTLGIFIFEEILETKNVTVKVPSGATGYGTSPTDDTSENWGNAFRGKGWDGTSYLTGTLNSNINLTITH
jgi:predicted DNA-binding transcriptional regulator AlpA